MNGYPIWVYAPLLISLVGVWIFMRGLTETKAQLDASGQGELATAVLYAGEERLKTLGVHASVWKTRGGVLLEAVGVLLFVAALLTAEVA